MGNASTDGPGLFPQEIGDYYQLPLGSDVPTGTIGLIEPGVGTALPDDDCGSRFQAALDTYRQQAGVPTGAPAIAVANGGQKYPVVIPGQNNAADECSLANSPIVLYAGSGTNLGAEHAPFTVYQSAFWDLVKAIVRLRQNGEDSLSLSFYRVDDFNGTIDGLSPGAAGYAAAAQGRAYRTTTGAMSVGGPGYVNYAQTGLVDVDAGDLIAMRLTNHTSGQTYWGFEDLHGGGDRDFNDLVVQFDFTSASGNGWLV